MLLVSVSPQRCESSVMMESEQAFFFFLLLPPQSPLCEHPANLSSSEVALAGCFFLTLHRDASLLAKNPFQSFRRLKSNNIQPQRPKKRFNVNVFSVFRNSNKHTKSFCRAEKNVHFILSLFERLCAISLSHGTFLPFLFFL